MSDGVPRPSAPADPAGTEPVSPGDLVITDLEATGEVSDFPHVASLPTSRSYDPPPPPVRQVPKETWEPQQRPTRRPDFADRVTRTSEVTLDPDAPARPKPPPRRTGAITWDDDKSAALRTAPEGEGALSRFQFLVLASLSAVVVVLGVSWAIKSLFRPRTIGRPVAMAAVASPLPSTEAAVVPSLSAKDYEEASSQANRFLTAPTLDAVMPVIRDPQRVRPLMETYYKENPWHPFGVRSLAPIEGFQSRGPMLAGIVELGDFGKRPMAFLRTPDGIKVDWEAFVGFGEIPWDRLAVERPTRPVLMRVHLTPDDYYNFDFPDSATYGCYRMVSRDTSHRFYGYVRRNLPLYGQLMQKNRPNAFTMPTVRIRFKEDGLSNEQVEITELVSDGWLVTDEGLPAAGTPAPASKTP